MSKVKQAIDRLYRRRFEQWEAPYEPGEAQSVFEQVQQQMGQPGNSASSSSGPQSGGGSVGSGFKGLVSGMKGWLITGATALVVGGGVGYAFFNAPSQPAQVQEDQGTSSMGDSSAKANKTQKVDPANSSQATNPLKQSEKDAVNDGKGQDSDPKHRKTRPSEPEAVYAPSRESEGKGTASGNGQSGDGKSPRNEQRKAGNPSSYRAANPQKAGPQSSGGSQAHEAFQVVIPDADLCPYDELTFMVKGMQDARRVAYKLGATDYKLIKGSRHSVDVRGKAGSRLLVVRVETDHQVKFDTQKLMVHPQPRAGFSVKKQGPRQVYLKAETTRTTNHLWLLGNGEQKRQGELAYTFGSDGTQTIRLVASGPNGCMDTATKKVRLKPAPEVELPNIFTPNGDGRNDRLVVTYGKLDSFQLLIKNEQGKVVFQSTDPERTWNGNVHNNGEPCNEGAYQYVLRYKYTFGSKIHQKSGKLLLKRSSF